MFDLDSRPELADNPSRSGSLVAVTAPAGGGLPEHQPEAEQKRRRESGATSKVTVHFSCPVERVYRW